MDVRVVCGMEMLVESIGARQFGAAKPVRTFVVMRHPLLSQKAHQLAHVCNGDQTAGKTFRTIGQLDRLTCNLPIA